jgi:hypothetical protein
MPEQVGEAALLIDPLLPEEIARSIHRMLHDVDMRKQLTQEGLKKIQSWTQQHFNERVKTILDRVITE